MLGNSYSTSHEDSAECQAFHSSLNQAVQLSKEHLGRSPLGGLPKLPGSSGKEEYAIRPKGCQGNPSQMTHNPRNRRGIGVLRAGTWSYRPWWGRTHAACRTTPHPCRCGRPCPRVPGATARSPTRCHRKARPDVYLG